MEGLLIDLSKLSELLLSSGIPDFEENRAMVGVEWDVGHIDSSRC